MKTKRTHVVPEEMNVQAAQALKPQGTFQPLGYVGDPANYDTWALVSVCWRS